MLGKYFSSKKWIKGYSLFNGDNNSFLTVLVALSLDKIQLLNYASEQALNSIDKSLWVVKAITTYDAF